MSDASVNKAGRETAGVTRQTTGLEGRKWALYQNYREPLTAYYVSQELSLADSEDLAHVTLLRVMNGLAKFRGDCNLRTWIFRIAINTLADFLKHPCREREILMTDLIAATGMDGDTEDFLDQVFAKYAPYRALPLQDGVEGSEVLGSALAQLTGQQRLALILDSNGFSNAEIGRKIGKSPASAGMFLMRTRQRVRALLAADT